MFNPVSTYRIQFHKDFTFNHLQQIIPYLQQLGIKTLYASPIFEAVPGSTHGYDVIDPHRINPEIGTVKQLRQISKSLKDAGISWVQDIVPNHMAFDPRNSWLMDVLEKGSMSAYADFFDTAGTSELFEGRIMVPFLGSALEEVINNNELTLAYHDRQLVLSYYDGAYPLKLMSYQKVLESTGGGNEAINEFILQLKQVHTISDVKAYALAVNELKIQLAALLNNRDDRQYIERCIEHLNQDKKQLSELADEQYYRLCNWQETDSKINFRRFFTVNGLICLNIHQPDVFKHYHKFIKQLLNDGVFQGLRVDHIDGLYDPAGYLENLRKLAGSDTYIVVEKILEKTEKLPPSWPIQDTTGYDYLAKVNNLLTNSNSESRFNKYYDKIVNDAKPVEQQIWDKKSYILKQHMAGELDNLTRYFCELNLIDEETHKQLPHDRLKEAIAYFLIYCPVYRYYGNKFPLSSDEADAVEKVLNRIRKRHPDFDDVTKLLESAFLKQPSQNNNDYNDRALRFYQRCMQLTGPLMAKGVEDTLMYTYNRFIAHNEVGDAPDAFGIPVDDFHALMKERQQLWPLAMNGTSTHDTKRGEDVRARLNALTALSDKWLQLVEEWRLISNANLNAPDLNDAYLIYQTIAGAYPMPGQDEDNFEERLHQYLEKALREAKQHSQWAEPNEAYETAAKTFASALLDKRSAFWKSFEPFHKQLSDHGIINSLVQVVLKFTSPGVPDVYQGCERWDLSLVDPDNRRPVDYTLSGNILDELQDNDLKDDIKALWNSRYTAKIKLWLTGKLLEIRNSYSQLFTAGEYLPLKVKGKYKAHVIAYARHHQRQWIITVLPLHLGVIQPELDLDGFNWASTRIQLPDHIPNDFENLLTGSAVRTGGELYLKDIFDQLPIAVVKFERKTNIRGAGILMHITSLPSSFGVGDMGPQAKQFADYLGDSLQKYWQILPLSPTELVNGHSPYSSFSSMAGNTLLISPELLVADGLLTASHLKKHAMPSKSQVDYKAAENVKDQLFDIAWNNFKKAESAELNDFKRFCQDQALWLDDYALYVVIKHHHAGKPWHQWHNDYKLRQDKILKAFGRKYEDQILKAKWLQFIFHKQWQGLRSYCSNKDIKLFGDLPFYVSYDSADVWANRELFSLDENGNMLGVAGVPPDYFNADGQLWGMPVFCWDKLKDSNYTWWIQRIKKNMELFDLVRLDHFRAFAAYWEVPAGETTAVNGKWQPGPGKHFFDAIKNELGTLPFIAEDLGDIDDDVYRLRDEFEFPGMKVLQFAFGDEIGASPYIPHNYTENFVAYTGTHDNNTTKGWFKQDAGAKVKKQVKQYTGIKPTASNIHELLCRLAFSSIAKTAIIPVQDIVGLDEDARMNTPASTTKNWLWRLKPGELNEDHQQQLREWTIMYNRA